MRRSHLIITVAGLVLVLVLAGSVYAYDSSRSDTIAKGVKVGAVDVGGLSAAAAQGEAAHAARLAAAEAARPRRRRDGVPAVGARGEDQGGRRQDGRRRRQARPRGIDRRRARGAASRAARSRRAWRPQVAYSEAAVRRIVDKVRVKMSRKPVEADISIQGQRVEVKKSQIGLSVDAKALKPKVEQALVTDVDANRAVRVTLKKTRPKVTTQEAREEVPRRPDRRPLELPHQPLQEAQEGRVLSDRRRRRRPRDAGRPLHDPEQGGQPGLVGARTRRGRARSPARSSPAASRPTRSRRAGWASPTASASTAPPTAARSAPTRRTAASACSSRTSSSSTTRCRSAPRSSSTRSGAEDRGATRARSRRARRPPSPARAAARDGRRGA